MGRLFDAVACLAGLCRVNTFEGQAAMALESALAGSSSRERYALDVQKRESPWTLDWGPMVEAILADRERGVPVQEISTRFHHALVDGLVAVAMRANLPRVVLSGGCFQNRYLTAGAIEALQDAGLTPYRHQRVPPNDGGVSLGQAVIAASRIANQPESSTDNTNQQPKLPINDNQQPTTNPQ
jgi:hydrogenase maturation protein HypF